MARRRLTAPRCPIHPDFEIRGKYGCPICAMLETSVAHDKAIMATKARFRAGRAGQFKEMHIPAPELKKEQTREEALMEEFPVGSVWGPWEVVGIPYYGHAKNGLRDWTVYCKKVDHATINAPLGCMRNWLCSRLRHFGRKQ